MALSDQFSWKDDTTELRKNTDQITTDPFTYEPVPDLPAYTGYTVFNILKSSYVSTASTYDITSSGVSENTAPIIQFQPSFFALNFIIKVEDNSNVIEQSYVDFYSGETKVNEITVVKNILTPIKIKCSTLWSYYSESSNTEIYVSELSQQPIEERKKAYYTDISIKATNDDRLCFSTTNDGLGNSYLNIKTIVPFKITDTTSKEIYALTADTNSESTWKVVNNIGCDWYCQCQNTALTDNEYMITISGTNMTNNVRIKGDKNVKELKINLNKFSGGNSTSILKFYRSDTLTLLYLLTIYSGA